MCSVSAVSILSFAGRLYTYFGDCLVYQGTVPKTAYGNDMDAVEICLFPALLLMQCLHECFCHISYSIVISAVSYFSKLALTDIDPCLPDCICKSSSTF